MNWTMFFQIVFLYQPVEKKEVYSKREKGNRKYTHTYEKSK